MKGLVNTPSVTYKELQDVREMAGGAAETATSAAKSAAAAAQSAETAQKAAETALEKLNAMTSVINTVPSQSGALTYTGSQQSPAWNNYDTSALEISGTTTGTNAGTYTATFTPKDGYQWSDGTQTAKNVTWTIGRATVTLPTQSGSLTYTGAAQSPAWNGYDSGKLTLSVTARTNAGSYTADFTPKDNYQWSDGTTGAKSAAWTIGKAAGSLSLSAAALSLTESSMTGSVTVTREGDGAVSASSGNTSVATVSVNGTTITVTGKASGTTTITVNVGAGTNHTAPSSKTFTVTVSILAAKTSATSGVTYTSGISTISQTDLNRYAQAISNNSAITNATSTVYIDDGDKHYKISVGDTVSIAVNGASYSFRVMGFNHDDLTSATAYGAATATGKAGFSFQMVDCLATTYAMNSSNTNSGGWNSCALRSTLQSTIKNTIAAAWTGIMKKVNKKTSAGSQSSTISTTSDDLFLLSEVEIFGSTSYSYSGEGSQYAYYKAGNSKVKYLNGSTYWWWERSPFSSSSTSFCAVGYIGDATNYSASYTGGVAFGFCV